MMVEIPRDLFVLLNKKLSMIDDDSKTWTEYTFELNSDNNIQNNELNQSYLDIADITVEVLTGSFNNLFQILHDRLTSHNQYDNVVQFMEQDSSQESSLEDNVEEQNQHALEHNKNIEDATNQQSLVLDYQTDDQSKYFQRNIEIDQKDNVVNDQSNSLIIYLFSWIYELPLWLQKQILSSAMIESMINNIKQSEIIYNKILGVLLLKEDMKEQKTDIEIASYYYENEDCAVLKHNDINAFDLIKYYDDINFVPLNMLQANIGSNINPDYFIFH